MRVLIPLFLLLFLTACGTERVVLKPEIVEVTKTEWREIPEDLTQQCRKAAIPEALTYGQALELWADDRAAVDTCNGRLAGIETLGEAE